jgi:integrase
MKEKITKAMVLRLKAPEKRTVIWDAGDGSTKGFGVKVEPSGKKIFIYQYRMGGRSTPTRRFTIGQQGAGLSVDQARKIAEGLERKVGSGIDPADNLKAENEIKRKARIEADAAKKGKVGLVVESYLKAIEEQDPPFRSAKERRRLLTAEVAGTNEKPGPWRSKLISEITKNDVKALLKRRPKRSIRHLQVALSALFKFAIAEELCSTNPAAKFDIKAIGFKPVARQKTLTPDEIRAIWSAASSTPHPYGPFFQLLLLTAQRRGEVAGLRWSELTPGNLSPWKIPRERAKNDSEHTVHLSPAALQVIKRVEKDSDLLFASSKGKPVSGFSKAFNALVEDSGVAGWRIHDLRRTFASVAAELLKIPPHVTDKILNHKTGTIQGVAAVYQRAEFLDERKAALDAWALFISLLSSDASADGIKKAVAAGAGHYHDVTQPQRKTKRASVRVVA